MSNLLAKTLTKISIFTSGKWVFVSLGTPTYVDGNKEYYRIDYPFGLLAGTEANPSNAVVTGKTADYVSKLAEDEELAYIPAYYFNTIVKPKNTVQPDPKPLNSNALQDPKFLDCIVNTGKPPVYNKTAKVTQSNGGSKKPKNSGDCNC